MWTKLTYSKTVTNTLVLTFTETIEFTASTEFGCNFIAAGGKASFSLKLGFQAQQQTTNTETNNYSDTTSFCAAANRKTIMDLKIGQAKFSDVDVVIKTKVQGYTAYALKDAISDPPSDPNKHWLWFPTASAVLRDLGGKFKGFYMEGDDVYFDMKGKITGGLSLNAVVTKSEEPLSKKLRKLFIQKKAVPDTKKKHQI